LRELYKKKEGKWFDVIIRADKGGEVSFLREK